MRNYTEQGKLPEKRNVANQRMYDTQDLDRLITVVSPSKEDKPLRSVIYARSSEGDKNHLQNQISELEEAYGESTYIIKDSGSGLNEKRRGLNKIISLAQSKDIDVVYITHRDRLTRFGYSYLERLLSTYGVSIVNLDNTDLSPQEDLMRDFMNLVDSFSGKSYSLRSRENKKKLLNKALSKVEENEQ